MSDVDAGAVAGEAVDKRDPARPKIALVTGYFREGRHLLERCLKSVAAQTVTTDHIVVADGCPQDWLDAAGVRHIRLDRSHGDYGGTPRGVGGLLAIAEDYDAIGFLDADNWLRRDHVELALAAAAGVCDFVVAQRHMMRPDETILDVSDEPIDIHVDTNCFLFFPGAFPAVHGFALIPRQLSGIGDRLFYANLRRQDLKAAIIPQKTVYYHCLWESLYRRAGECPPPSAKPNIDQAPMTAWLAGLSPRHLAEASRRTGLALGAAAGAALAEAAPDEAIRTFDVFDTLIARRCFEPWRIFDEVGAIAGLPDFVVQRRAAETEVCHGDYSLDDIYDRLAARCGFSAARRDELRTLELARELENVVPIAEHLAEVRDGDLLISDMYMTPAEVRRLLDRVGLARQVGLHVEAHGKSSGRIWPLLAARGRIARHRGDNPHSDGEMPRRFAIKTALTKAAAFTLVEETLDKAGLRSLALLCREARLATWHEDPRLRAMQLVQVGVNLPLLLLASIALARRALALGKTSIAFCSRDCNLWLPLFEEVQRRMGLSLDCRYFLTSRIARTKGSQAYLDYAGTHVHTGSLVVDLCGTGWSMAHLAARLGRTTCDLFLVDHLPRFAAYEQTKATPETCVIHPLFDTQRMGNNMILEAANLADHGMITDMRQVGSAFVPQFEAAALSATESAAIAAQRGAFRQATALMKAHKLDDVLSLDDPSLKVLCGSLYQYLSNQGDVFQILADAFMREDRKVMRNLVA